MSEDKDLARPGTLTTTSAAQLDRAALGENDWGLRHTARRDMFGSLEIVDRQFNFVRCILPYDYAYTSNAQQWSEARRICEALEGPMSAQGIMRIAAAPDDGGPSQPSTTGEGDKTRDEFDV